MLQAILAIFQQAEGRALSREAVAAQLDVQPDVLDHMLMTLERRGRLVVSQDACYGCETCPLHAVCATVPAPSRRGYRLPSGERRQLQRDAEPTRP